MAATIDKTSSIAEQCGNCWGHQLWIDRFRPKRRLQKSSRTKAFILKFVEKYL